jgi:hypothetical protein
MQLEHRFHPQASGLQGCGGAASLLPSCQCPRQREC